MEVYLILVGKSSTKNAAMGPYTMVTKMTWIVINPTIHQYGAPDNNVSFFTSSWAGLSLPKVVFLLSTKMVRSEKTLLTELVTTVSPAGLTARCRSIVRALSISVFLLMSANPYIFW